jgi:hypothetical protein
MMPCYDNDVLHPEPEEAVFICRECNDVFERPIEDHVQSNRHRPPIAPPVEYISQKIVVGEGNAHAFPPLAFDPRQVFLDVLWWTLWVSAETALKHHPPDLQIQSTYTHLHP